jgi:hypothetical protein
MANGSAAELRAALEVSMRARREHAPHGDLKLAELVAS